MFAILLPILGWFLGKNLQRDSQVKSNGSLIEVCEGLVRVQKNNLKIQELMFEQYKQREIREQRHEIIKSIRYYDEQLEKYKDNEDIKICCLKSKQFFENLLSEFDEERRKDGSVE